MWRRPTIVHATTLGWLTCSLSPRMEHFFQWNSLIERIQKYFSGRTFFIVHSVPDVSSQSEYNWKKKENTNYCRGLFDFYVCQNWIFGSKKMSILGCVSATCRSNEKENTHTMLIGWGYTTFWLLLLLLILISRNSNNGGCWRYCSLNVNTIVVV